MISSGVPVATTYKGTAEPTQVIPETFRTNQPGNGTADDIVGASVGRHASRDDRRPPPQQRPDHQRHRHNRPLDPVHRLQRHPRALDFFRLLSHADDVTEAIDAQGYFDFGA